jgi:very-short-patch-repair endonuclease
MTDDARRQYAASSKQWDKLKPGALQMRHEPTIAEDALWQRIRNRQVGGVKFRRQHAIEGFIADFACIEHRLIIEVDGEIHNQVDQEDRDVERQAILEAHGFRVLRFTNVQVLESIGTVVEGISQAIKD